MEKIVSIKINGAQQGEKDIKKVSRAIKDLDENNQDLQRSLGNTSKSLEENRNKAVAGLKDYSELKREFKEIKQALTEMLANGVDPANETFLKLAERAGQIKDSMSDASETINRFSSDTKGIDDAIGVFTTLTNTIGLATGALALFGDENEELQKILTKVQAVMVITNSVQKLSNDLKKQGTLVNKLYTAATQQGTAATTGNTLATTTNTAATTAGTAATGLFTKAQILAKTAVGGLVGGLRALWAAMLANPITAALAGITALVTAFGYFKNKAKEAKEAQEDFNKTLQEGKIAASQAIAASNNAQYEFQITTQKRKMAEKEARDASYKESKEYYDDLAKLHKLENDKIVGNAEAAAARAAEGWRKELLEKYGDYIKEWSEMTQSNIYNNLNKYSLNENATRNKIEYFTGNLVEAIDVLTSDGFRTALINVDGYTKKVEEYDRVVQNLRAYGSTTEANIIAQDVLGTLKLGDANAKLAEIENKLAEAQARREKAEKARQEALKRLEEEKKKREELNKALQDTIKNIKKIEDDTTKINLDNIIDAINDIPVFKIDDAVASIARFRAIIKDSATDVNEFAAIDKLFDEFVVELDEAVNKGDDIINEWHISQQLLLKKEKDTAIDNAAEILAAKENQFGKQEEFNAEYNKAVELAEATYRSKSEKLDEEFNKKLQEHSIDTFSQFKELTDKYYEGRLHYIDEDYNKQIQTSQNLLRERGKISKIQAKTQIAANEEIQSALKEQVANANTILNNSQKAYDDYLESQRELIALLGRAEGEEAINNILNQIRENEEAAYSIIKAREYAQQQIVKSKTEETELSEANLAIEEKSYGWIKKSFTEFKKQWEDSDFSGKFSMVSDLMVESLDNVANLMNNIADSFDSKIEEATKDLEELTSLAQQQSEVVASSKERLTTLQDKYINASAEQREMLKLQMADEEANLAAQKKKEEELLRQKELAEKKKEALEKKQKKIQLKASLVTAIADVAAGVAKALGSSIFPLNLVNAALVSAAGAVEVSTISNQLSKLRDGGILEGPSHEQGGIKGTGSFSNIEVEGGEAIIPVRTVKKHPDLINSLLSETNNNYKSPRTKFKNGGLLSSQQSFNYSVLEKIINTSISRINFTPVVSVVDITDAQNNIVDIKNR